MKSNDFAKKETQDRRGVEKRSEKEKRKGRRRETTEEGLTEEGRDKKGEKRRMREIVIEREAEGKKRNRKG